MDQPLSLFWTDHFHISGQNLIIYISWPSALILRFLWTVHFLLMGPSSLNHSLINFDGPHFLNRQSPHYFKHGPHYFKLVRIFFKPGPHFFKQVRIFFKPGPHFFKLVRIFFKPRVRIFFKPEVRILVPDLWQTIVKFKKILDRLTKIAFSIFTLLRKVFDDDGR